MSNATGPQAYAHRNGELVPAGMAASVQIYTGCAAAIVLGTGFVTPLVAGTINHQFYGMFTESKLEATGVAGSTFTRILRRGLVPFAQTGTTITAAFIEENAYFSDDHTVTLTAGAQVAGVIAAVDASGTVWVDIENAVRSASLGGKNWQLLSGSTDAINPHIQANYMITTAGVDAATLAAPTAVTDDGVELIISSDTSQAHTITATGLLHTGTASVNVATFAAQKGAGLTLKAYNAKWKVLGSVGITFS